MKLFSTSLKIITFLFLSSCGTTTVVTNSVHKSDLQKLSYTKVGKSCAYRFFSISSGHSDLSIDSAKKDGKIEEVVFVEKERRGLYLLYLVFSEVCTVVKGN